MKNLNNCPVCKNEAFNDLLTCRDFSVSKEDFKIVSCENCEFTFTNPRPENGDLDNYYLSDNMIYDLENNIPYIHSRIESLKPHCKYNLNERKVYWDSSRCISL